MRPTTDTGQRLTLLVIGVGTLSTWFGSAGLVAWFLIWVWPSRVGIALGLLLLTLVLAVRPRLPRLPAEHARVKRVDCPELFRLLDKAAEQIGAPQVDILAFDASVGASTLRVGLRRRFAIVIGFPLWEALPPHERLALLTHELGHETNGDLWRTPLVGTSLGVLVYWHEATQPGRFEDASRRGLTGILTWALLLVPHEVLGTLVRLQHRLSLESHRQSEFGADHSAATVAGTKAVLALFDRLILSSSIEYATQQSAQRATEEPGMLWANIRQRMIDLPEGERQEIRRVALAEETSSDSTHPATGQRIAAIKALEFHPPAFLFDTTQNSTINEELAMARALMEPVALRNGGSQNA